VKQNDIWDGVVKQNFIRIDKICSVPTGVFFGSWTFTSTKLEDYTLSSFSKKLTLFVFGIEMPKLYKSTIIH